MGSSTSDPKDIAIVVVQGSFHTPQAYQKLTDGLKHQGYATFQPELPSCSKTDDADFPSKTLHDDSAVIKSVAERLVNDEGKKVFVVMHSYGGLVGGNAISRELSFKYRKSAGLPGGVIHLLYVTAFVLDERQSVLGTFGESPNNDVKVSKTPMVAYPVVIADDAARAMVASSSKMELLCSTTIFPMTKRLIGNHV
jgi:hypothetical protein